MSLTQEIYADRFKTGSIKRIKLKNFLTYTHAVVEPGPRLNVVMGPNGTGKSTILCAICLGLGGEPKLLGRADDARLFINHEHKRASIEIELTPHISMSGDEAETHIFRREIDGEKGSEKGNGRGASTFYINDEKVTAKEVRRIVSEVYHISVDNMCTFLPQDKVGSFSGFNAQSLLKETEKSISADGRLYEMHENLIHAEEELRKGGNEEETLQKKVQELEAENERLEREKERMEAREKALEQIDLLDKKILWLQFDSARSHACELKDAKSAAKDRLKEAQQSLAPLQEEAATLEENAKKEEARHRTLDVNVKKLDRELSKHRGKAEKHNDAMDEITSNLTSIDAEQRNALRKVDMLKEKLEDLEEQAKHFPSKESLTQLMTELKQEQRSVKPAQLQARQEVGRLKEQHKELEDRKKRAQEKLEKANDERSQRRERVFRQYPNLQKAYQFIEENRTKFRRPVLGPIVCEINPKTRNMAAYLEQHVPNPTLKAFVVECKEDNDFLYREVRGKMKVPINIIEVRKSDPVQRMYSEAKMNTLRNEHGVMGFMDQSFTAPDSVVEALIGAASVDKVLIGTEETQKSIDRRNLLDFLTKRESGSGLMSCCIFTNHMEKSYKYTASISRYSGKAATRIDEINAARMLAPGYTAEQKAEMEKSIKDISGEIESLVPTYKEAEARYNEYTTAGQEVNERIKKVSHDQGEWKKHEQKVKTSKRKLKEAEEAATSDNAAEKKKLLKGLMARIKGNVSSVEAHADCHAKMMESIHMLAGVKISQDGLNAAARKARQLLEEKGREFAELEQKFVQVNRAFQAAKQNLQAIKRRADEEAPIHDNEGNELPLKAQLDALPCDNLEEADFALEEQTTIANSIDANPDVVRQYELRKVEIEKAKATLQEMTENKNTMIDNLQTQRGPWEAKLKNTLEKVNVLFSKYMKELGCAGEVQLLGPSNNKRDDQTLPFKDWGIEIKVKFREKSSLQVLSAQVQSGGERSVSTIMYLMALQEMMVSPFRCVDEINQGLDERNERLVFQRIVENSTRPPESESSPASHSGQYFLITPKLLPNLEGMENDDVTVLCIFNGQRNMKHPRDWDVAKLLELKRSRKQ